MEWLRAQKRELRSPSANSGQVALKKERAAWAARCDKIYLRQVKIRESPAFAGTATLLLPGISRRVPLRFRK